MPQAVRGQLVPGLDARVAGQTAHQFPKVPLPEAAAAGRGQQRADQLPCVTEPGPVCPVSKVGVQRGDRGRGQRYLRPPGAFAHHPHAPGARHLLPGR